MILKNWDVIIVGGGHAGIEAAHASAKMGANTLLLSSNIDLIAHMPCNPSIGGIGKGQLVKEIDALGGLMGVVTDQTALQFRRLNTKKGHAVRSSRAQVDKVAYRTLMQDLLFRTPNLTIIQDSIQDLILNQDQVVGIVGQIGTRYYAHSIVITPGTFLNGIIRIGEFSTSAGRMGESSSIKLSEQIREIGFKCHRFKTGTPPRIDQRSIDFSKAQIHEGDNPPRPFSFRTDFESFEIKQYPCYLTHTTEESHQIIRDNIHKAPMYSGNVDATGVRYCPSIEDKVMKFPNHSRHHVFLEPESLSTGEIYPNGLSNALPYEVQEALIRSIPCLENAIMTRPAYAIEHDFIDPTELNPWLETKKISNLFLAGQINGTTGYEEAGALGLMAGINAALKALGKEPFILNRTESYIGVMIDDLTTLGTVEPYRMFTSRVEYRLIIREDNADQRLSPYAFKLGLIDEITYTFVQNKYNKVNEIIKILEENFLSPSDRFHSLFEKLHTSIPLKKVSYSEILKRPEVQFQSLKKHLSEEGIFQFPDLDYLSSEQIEINVKYQGYIDEELKRINEIKDSEEQIIPNDFPYNKVSGLRLEEIEKLSSLRPHTLGQITRIPGIRPAAVHIIALVLKFNGDKGLNTYSTEAPTWGHSSSLYKNKTQNKGKDE